VPADLAAGSISGEVTSHREITAVPPRMTRFDGQLDLWPSQIEVSQLARQQSQRVLALWLGQPGRSDRGDEIQLVVTSVRTGTR
jgi:hypothetical protein